MSGVWILSQDWINLLAERDWRIDDIKEKMNRVREYAINAGEDKDIIEKIDTAIYNMIEEEKDKFGKIIDRRHVLYNIRECGLTQEQLARLLGVEPDKVMQKIEDFLENEEIDKDYL